MDEQRGELNPEPIEGTSQQGGFCRRMLSASGDASFGRTASFLALIVAMAWISYIVWETHQLPPLEGVTAFIGTLYGVSKTGETVQRTMGRKP